MAVGLYSGAGRSLITLWYLPETPTGKHFPNLSGIWWYQSLRRHVRCRGLVPCSGYRCSRRVLFCSGNQYDSGRWGLSVLPAMVFLPLWYLVTQFEAQMGSWGDWYSPIPIFTGFQDLSEKFWVVSLLTFFIVQQSVTELKCEQLVRSLKDRRDVLRWVWTRQQWVLPLQVWASSCSPTQKHHWYCSLQTVLHLTTDFSPGNCVSISGLG